MIPSKAICIESQEPGALSMFTIHEATILGESLRYGVLTNPDSGTRKNRTLLFVPGLGGSVKGALDFLTEILPAYDAIFALDLRGFGLNNHVRLPNPNAYLDDLDAFIRDVVKPEGALSLAGISLGGAIATRLAVRHPNRFDKLVLIAPAYKASPVSFPVSYVVKTLLGKILGGKDHKATLPYGIEALTRNEALLSHPDYQHKDRLQVLSGFLLSASFFNQSAFSATNQIACPTMMLVPGKDIVCDPEAMRQGFARIPDTTEKVLKDYPALYHDILFEPEAPQVAAEVRDWLETV